MGLAIIVRSLPGGLEKTEFLIIEPKSKLLSLGSGGVSAQLASSVIGDVAAHAVERAYFARYGL